MSLPNNKNIIMAAEQCIRLVEGKQVVVLPSKTVPQGISAMLAFDPDCSVEENTQAMSEALRRVSTSEVTYAARDSDFDGFAIRQGDYLALAEHQLFGTDKDIYALLRRLAEAQPQQDAEFITVFYGEDVQESDRPEGPVHFPGSLPQGGNYPSGRRPARVLLHDLRPNNHSCTQGGRPAGRPCFSYESVSGAAALVQQKRTRRRKVPLMQE